MKQKLLSIKQKVIDFYCSDWFIVALAAIVILFWAVGWDIVGCTVLVAIGCAYLWLGRDLKPVVAIILLFVLQISLTQVKSKEFLITACVLGAIAVISFTFNLIWFRKQRKYSKGKLFYGMLAFYVATVFSGILNPEYDKIWMLAILGVGPCIYLVYFLCVNCVEGDLREIFCKLLFFAALITAVETIIYFIRQPDFVKALVGGGLRVGWGMSNTMAVFFVMAVPAVVYLGTRIKLYSYIMFPSCGLFSVLLCMTLSRGNILFGVPIIIIAVVYGFIKAKQKKSARIILASTVAVCIALLFIIPGVDGAVQTLLKQGVGLSGRDKLYKDAIERFLKQPIFGAGYFKPKGTVYPLDGPSFSFMWKIHNTLLQILSCSGIVGILGMIPYFYQRYRTLIKDFSSFKFMALLSVLAYELEGMLDVAFLSIHQLFFVLALLAAAEKETKAVRGKAALKISHKVFLPTVRAKKRLENDVKDAKRDPSCA